jgi:two-component system sensor histidine kinase AtoS
MQGEGRLVLRSCLDAPDSAPVMVAVAVVDSGPGIEATRMARVFELFYTTKPTGTGVGLAMARRLVERQRGTIAASSTPGAGTVFTLRLPLARTRSVESPRGAA